MTLQLAKVVTALTEKGWSQIHTFSPEQKEKLASHGHLLAVITLGGAEKEEMAALGRETITRLHEEYYGSAAGVAGGGTSPLIKLKQAIKKLMVEAGPESQLSVTAAVLVNKVLYVAILGQGRLILRRKSRTETILAGSSAENIVTASGYLENGDTFLLGTGDFFQLVPEEVVQKALAAGTVDEAAEILAPIAHESNGQGLVAAVAAKVEEGKTKKKLRLWLPKLNRITSSLQRVKFNRLSQPRAGQPLVKKKTLFTVALVLILILGVSVILGKQKREKGVQKQKMAVLLEQIQEKKEEGEAVIELNPVRAKELLFEAQDLLKQAEAEGGLSEDFSQIKEELEALLPQVLREHEIEPELFFDLVLIKDDAAAGEAVLSASNLFVLDKTKASVYRLSLPDKKSAIIGSGGKLETSFQITAFGPEIFVLAEEGILQLKEKAKEQILAIDSDKNWGEIVDLQSFGGNLYLLTDNNIWAYSRTESGFGAKRNWLKSEANLANTVSMAIDGSIWVLKSDGTILKFIQGKKEAFGVAGLDKPIKNPKAIFTNEDTEALYILDNGNSRVVVLEKSGEYHSQYLWSGISEATGLAVSKQENKIFLFSQNKIYAIEIK